MKLELVLEANANGARVESIGRELLDVVRGVALRGEPGRRRRQIDLARDGGERTRDRHGLPRASLVLVGPDDDGGIAKELEIALLRPVRSAVRPVDLKAERGERIGGLLAFDQKDGTIPIERDLAAIERGVVRVELLGLGSVAPIERPAAAKPTDLFGPRVVAGGLRVPASLVGEEVAVPIANRPDLLRSAVGRTAEVMRRADLSGLDPRERRA
jgi:hypothetical protein